MSRRLYTLLSAEKIRKLPIYIYYFIKCFILFTNPLSVIYHYIRRSFPPDKVVRLRSGLQIYLSDHPHDIVTVFVVLVKEDYGKVMRDSIVVDIGANIGVFSLYAVYAGARKIYAYEPNQQAYEVLLRNIAHNELEDVIVPYKLAVSGSNDETVQIPLGSSPYNRVVAGNAIGNYDRVGTITLERILRDNTIDFVNLLKIDCEGAEYRILFNTKKSVFSKIGDIKMEYHEGPVDDLISYLKVHGFHLIYFNSDRAVLWVNKSE